MITEIVFKRTSNIFINAGIVALYQYLKQCEEDAVFGYPYNYRLDKDSLQIKSHRLFDLLEEIYYFMGKEIYDTSGKNARQSPDKFYFTENPFRSVPFYKMKTYGLGALITNDPQPAPKNPNNAVTFESIVSKKPEFAKEIGKIYFEKRMKLKNFEPTESGFRYSKESKGDSRIFLNEPYIKITRLEKPEDDYFKVGDQVCSLTNERYKKLVDSQNTSPFIKGINNFNSFLTTQSQKISWKAMYLSRFSPKLGLYTYVRGLDSMVGYFFDSNDLLNLNALYQRNKSMYKDSAEMIESNYMSNFKTYSFFNNGERYSEPKDYVGKNETLFALIYTMYQQFLYDKGLNDISEVENISDLDFDKIPVSLVAFKANSFSATLRPNAFKYFNNFKSVVYLMIYLEKSGVKFSMVLSSLKFLKTADKNSLNSYQLQRKLREKVLALMLDGKSIAEEIAHLYFLCYTYLLRGDSIGFKNFDQLYLLTSIYELKINKKMTQEMQEKAFSLGSSIGMAIVNFDETKNGNDRKPHAKNGRKFIVDLIKSRTLDQFNEAIIRIMNRFEIPVSSELFLEHLNEQNFQRVKQFAIIGALNVINKVIKPVSVNSYEK